MGKATLSPGGIDDEERRNADSNKEMADLYLLVSGYALERGGLDIARHAPSRSRRTECTLLVESTIPFSAYKWSSCSTWLALETCRLNIQGSLYLRIVISRVA